VARAAGLSVALITNSWLLPSHAGCEDGANTHRELDDVVTLMIVCVLSRALCSAGRVHDRSPTDPLRPRLLVNTVLSRHNRGALRRVARWPSAGEPAFYFCPMETGVMLATGFSASKRSLALPRKN